MTMTPQTPLGEVVMLDGKKVFIVDLRGGLPTPNITGYINRAEELYNKLLYSITRGYAGALSSPESRSSYANALEQALKNGVITEPGKYAIHIPPGTNAAGRARYEIYTINEPIEVEARELAQGVLELTA